MNMTNHIHKTCEKCLKSYKMKGINISPSGHILCKRCYLSNTSTNAHRKANKAVRIEHFGKSKGISSQEEKVLISLYEKGHIPYPEWSRRMLNLRRAIKDNHAMAKLNKKEVPFQEAFQELKQKRKE